MTVRVKQRIPDKDTLERHDTIKSDVVQVDIYKSATGAMFVYLSFKDGQGLHLPLTFFDFEITEE